MYGEFTEVNVGDVKVDKKLYVSLERAFKMKGYRISSISRNERPSTASQQYRNNDLNPTSYVTLELDDHHVNYDSWRLALTKDDKSESTLKKEDVKKLIESIFKSCEKYKILKNFTLFQ